MRRFVLICLLLPFSASLFSQTPNDRPWFGKRYINGIINDTTPDWKPKFLIYPTVAFAPETSWEFGVSALLLYHANEDTLNRLSELQAFGFVTVESQYGLWLENAVYTDQNDWFFLGNAKFQNFPLFYHGIGPDAPEEIQALVEGRFLIFNERVLRKINHSLYGGIGLAFQNMDRVDFVLGEDVPSLDLPLGYEGSLNLSAGLSLVYDDRHNVLNVRDGNFYELTVLHSNTAWGSDFSFTNIISDNRIYRPVRNGRDVFAAQVMAQFSTGDVPFNQLSLMGGERLMRGYYLGRYRDNNLLAGQVEYRFLPFKPFKRWGAAAFMGAGTVYSEEHPLNLDNFQLAGGAGFRFLIFPEKDIFLRLDIAVTREGPGYYFFIGEAF